ncbi:hypothetical protein TNCV_206731 [Trichonephila clavipes]|nr:hypothetical protein TNCV_206731 [Trichonephila clavipes]
MLRRLVGTQLLDIMIVQFRNEKLVILALYRSPLTVTLWRFIIFEEGLPQPIKRTKQTVGSLVVRASDSRPEDLGLMPDATKYLRVHKEYVLAKSVGRSLVRADMPPLSPLCWLDFESRDILNIQVAIMRG